MKCQEETDRLNRPGLRKTGHHQIVAMCIRCTMQSMWVLLPPLHTSQG